MYIFLMMSLMTVCFGNMNACDEDTYALIAQFNFASVNEPICPPTPMKKSLVRNPKRQERKDAIKKEARNANIAHDLARRANTARDVGIMEVTAAMINHSSNISDISDEKRQEFAQQARQLFPPVYEKEKENNKNS